MKTIVTALIALGFAAGSLGTAGAADSPWQIRARVLQLDPANKSDPIGGVGASDLIAVSNKTIPEVDISYFFTPNWAAELVLTVPQKHDVSVSGTEIGTFKHLPPSLLLQYHFTPGAQFSPYVGAGVNYTRIFSVKLLNGAADLESSSIGLAVQAGFDVKIDKNWSFNVDVKKIQIRSDVMLNGAKVSSVRVDPLLFGVGLGYRF